MTRKQAIILAIQVLSKIDGKEEFISLSSCQNSAMIKDREKLN